jgi:FAD/FMN-containing dehydrogenase
MEKSSILKKLESIVGPEYVASGGAILETYGAAYLSGKGVRSDVTPDFVVIAGSVEEVQNVVRLANRYSIPIIPIGSSTSMYSETTPFEGGIMLNFGRMNHIDVDLNDRKVTFEPGVSWGQAYRELTPLGYQVHYPSLAGAISVLGTTTQRGAPAPIRIGYYCEETLGLEVVLPTGEIVQTGSGAQQGAKIYARYVLGPDLTGIFLGAQGTLGIVTKQTMPLYKIPETRGAVEGIFKTFKDTIKPAHRLMDDNFFPERVTVNKAEEGKWEMYVQMVGNKERVEFDKEMAKKILTEEGGAQVQESKIAPALYPIGAALFRWLPPTADPEKFDYKSPYSIPGKGMPTPPGGGLIGPYLWIEYSKSGDLIDAEEKIFEKYGIPAKLSGVSLEGRWGIYGQVGVCAHFDASDPKQGKVGHDIILDCVQKGIDLGAVIYRLDPLSAAIVLPKLGGYYQLLKRLKQMLDPNRIMTPGAMGL